MPDFTVTMAAMFTLSHFVASMWKWPRNKVPPGIDIELMRQHHERCAMLGVIALAILHKF